ncbi:hypothetical protein CBOM_07671 [Ceraceosorus bombacis]|uniref:Uncharacterized protein n=1 Tax=Ceraceosorus bombacis TaxID=401625 RepID=A0A0P1BNG3_9BASI|nr:hypothetical protein CBOM_07671 [Ceraceosorus bombacis]
MWRNQPPSVHIMYDGRLGTVVSLRPSKLAEVITPLSSKTISRRCRNARLRLDHPRPVAALLPCIMTVLSSEGPTLALQAERRTALFQSREEQTAVQIIRGWQRVGARVRVRTHRYMQHPINPTTLSRGATLLAALTLA